MRRNQVLLFEVPRPPAVALCLDPACPFKASALTPEKALVKLEAHVSAWHPDLVGTPQEAA